MAATQQEETATKVCELCRELKPLGWFREGPLKNGKPIWVRRICNSCEQRLADDKQQQAKVKVSASVHTSPAAASEPPRSVGLGSALSLLPNLETFAIERTDAELDYLLLLGLLRRLPHIEQRWTVAARTRWLRAFGAALDLLIAVDGEEGQPV